MDDLAYWTEKLRQAEQDLDASIERRLAAFDSIPPEVRRAAWTVAFAVQRLSLAGAL